MIKKVLIANRGEIAVRIIRACRNMGILSVAIYSKEDENGLHTQLADQRICIGEGPARDSYLNMDRIISAALNVDADAIHPGFGFLSENSAFPDRENPRLAARPLLVLDRRGGGGRRSADGLAAVARTPWHPADIVEAVENR